MYYSSRHVRLLYDISAETVRNWCDEFTEYLSPTAIPGKGKHRNFTEDDMRVFDLIAQMKGQGLTYEQIHASLNNGQRGNVPELPAEEMHEIIVAEEQGKLTFEIEVVQRALRLVTQERDELEGKYLALREEVQPVKDENIRLETRLEETRSQMTSLEETLEGARKRIEELNREIGKSYHEGYIAGLKDQKED